MLIILTLQPRTHFPPLLEAEERSLVVAFHPTLPWVWIFSEWAPHSMAIILSFHHFRNPLVP